MNKPIDNSLEHHLLHPVEDVEPFLERLFFNNRRLVVLLFLMLTVFLGYQAIKIRPDASFIKMIPTYHPYIANYLENREDLSGLGNAVRISVATSEGDIFTEEFQRTLMEVNDAVFFLPGVDRTGLKSIWTPRVRWTEVTEEGFVGGPVIPNSYDGSEASLEQLRTNVLRSGQVGSLVANDFRSAIIYAPLFDVDPKTGERLDYQLLSEKLEADIREKFQNDKVKIHITGFAKVVGELIGGASEVALFFVVALLITMVMLYLYSRCLLSTLIPLLCSVVAVVWQLGILQSLGMGLDPYSMLVPFLVFAIGVSHGVQIINSIAHERMKGADKRRAAQLTFRSLYIPGLTALFSDGIGFITLMVIQIEVIQDLAVAASIGVAVIILTNLVLLPLLMSFTGISESAVRSLEVKESGSHPVWRFLSGFTQPGLARITVVIAVLASATGLYLSKDLKIGDLDAGAPELHPTSVYNQDNAFIVKNYSASTDVFVVMVKTSPDACLDYDTFAAVDRFQWHMENVPGVQFATSLVSVSKRVLSGLNEGSLKWQALNRNQAMLNNSVATAPQGLMNTDCSMLPVMVFLNDHKAETLERVVAAAQAFAEDNNSDDLQFVMAAGNAGIEAATNIVIGQSQYEMLLWVYAVVSLLCLITFRSVRTVACIILPLLVTSILCQALMAKMGMGVKVATLPVIALGVGIGVDYGIYIYSKLETFLSRGMALKEAYFHTLKTTGRAVAFTGLTLAVGVGTWVLSPIKFQADMGILLTFMFLWNMIGALVLLPALAHLLIKFEPGYIKKTATVPYAESNA